MSPQGPSDQGVFGPPPDRALLIAAEKVRVQYRNMPTAFVGSAVVSTLMGFALVKGVGVEKVAIWIAFVYAWAVARCIQWRAFNRINPSPRQMGLWRRLGVVGSVVAGLIWGVGAVVMYVPDGLAYQLFLVMGMVGMGAGCVYASASVMPSFFAYFYPSILFPAARFLFADDSLHFVIGVLMIVYLSLMTPFALRVYRLIDESIKLRFENLGLIGELRAQKEAAGVANVAKSRFLAAASHDLRQPLHALRLFVQALQETSTATRERQVIGDIRRSVDAVEELFNALLDISRLEAGVVRPHMTTLPLAAADCVPAQLSPQAAAFDLSHSLVLVIDDEAAVQEAMAALLRRWKCDVLTAGSGAEMKGKLVALQRLPDLIVADYRLRGTENGIQVVEMLRSEFNADIPALLVTGDKVPDGLRDTETSGLPILHKPLNPARLRTLIENLLREHTRAA